MNIINQFQNKKIPKQGSLEMGEVKSKTELRKIARLISKIGISLIFLLISSLHLQAQNPNTAQWKSVGGQKIMSGNHRFTTSWSSSPESRNKGLYWKGSFYESNPQYYPWDPDVKNSVAPLIGQFTVQGPGHIGLFSKATGGRIEMHIADTKETFHPFQGNNFNPAGEFWGRISDNFEVTIEVYAIMSSYNNQNLTGEFAYHAPQEITEFEVWFFPKDGGKIINIDAPTTKFNKPKPGILYYLDKECK